MTLTDKTPNAIKDISLERQRQISAEGYDFSHDDRYVRGELARAAAAYAVYSTDAFPLSMRALWPWEDPTLKPKSARRNLIRAAALLVAEIERIDRTEAKPA